MRMLRETQRSKTLLMTRAAVESAVRHGHPEAHLAMRGYRTLRTMSVRAPAHTRRVLDSPHTGLWALRTLQAVERGQPLPPGGLTDVIARAGGTPRPGIEAESGGLWMSLRVDGLAGGYRPDTTPDDELRLDRWRADIAAGWQILVRHHRPVAEEFAAAMSVLVPVRRKGDGHFSATLRHAFGMLIMSRPPDGKRAALTFAHELMHAKLSAIMDLFLLVEPGVTELFHAPWRPDPRPASALLQGIYAHLGVAAFWRRQARAERDAVARAEAQVEFVRWGDGAARAAAALLDRDVLTPVGARFVRQIAGELGRYLAEPVPAEIVTEARWRNEEHRRRVGGS